jgi:hypothetical protein
MTVLRRCRRPDPRYRLHSKLSERIAEFLRLSLQSRPRFGLLVDLSRFGAGQLLMLGGLSFEGHGAFPAQG